MFDYKALIGINTVHMDVKTIKTMGFSRFEICLGRGMPYSERLEQIQAEIVRADEYGLKYSVHHPIYLFDGFPYDYLDAFFLDPDGQKRQLSIQLLEENLKRLQGTQMEYLVVHFPGVYAQAYMEQEAFEKLLEEVLDQIEKLAIEYDKDVLLEYFGSNMMFAQPDHWIKALEGRSHMGILTDTGHLYFASLLRGFSYEKALKQLAPFSKAFHLWTTRGMMPYGDNDYYRKYHHVMAAAHQKIEDGWAFDPLWTLDCMLEQKRPIIIEASPTYGGTGYFMRGIEQIRDHAQNYRLLR